MLENILKILDKAVVSDVRVYDTRTYTPYYDTVIICSANSNRQGSAAANYLKSLKYFLTFSHSFIVVISIKT